MAQLERNCLGSAVNMNCISGLQQESLRASAFGCCHEDGFIRPENAMARRFISPAETSFGVIAFADLAVEGPVIVKNSQPKQPERH